LNEIYFGKTEVIVNSLRTVQNESEKAKQFILNKEISDALKTRQETQQKNRQHSKEEN